MTGRRSPSPPPGPAGHQHLLIRRIRRTGELADHRCYSPQPVRLSTLVRVTGSRWAVEETFQSPKTLAGLDEHQVRRWDSWHRRITLALLAHAFPAVVAALEQHGQADDGTSPNGLIPLTYNEIQRLFTTVSAQPSDDFAHRLPLVHLAPTSSSPRPTQPLPTPQLCMP